MVTYRSVPGIFCAVVLAFTLSSASAAIQFTDATTGSGVEHQNETYGASWGDLNGDGYPDLFVSNHRTQPSLYLNAGNGTFIDVAKQTFTWINKPNADTHGGSWVDYDSDGDLDLLVATGTGNPLEFLGNERGALIDRSVEAGLTTDNWGGRLAVWFDYDGDKVTDFVMTQMGGVGKVMRQVAGVFTDQTSTVKESCTRFHYGQLLDVNNDGHLDFVCPFETSFPQKVYDTVPLPWKNLTSSLPPVANVVDTAIADFNNDGRMDVFYVSGGQLRPSSVAADGGNKVEALLMGGEKGFNFVTGGQVTFDMYWNRQNVLALQKVYIGAGGTHPTTTKFTLDPTDPAVAGMPADTGETPILRMGYDPATQRWTLIMRSVNEDNEGVWSDAYFLVTSTEQVSGLLSSGLWGTDKAAVPTLLMNTGSGFIDQTAAAGLSAPIQCVSATAGDYDNDMDVDLYLVCRTGVSNLANILYENQGNGTFVAVPNAGGAAGPIGLAVGQGAGTGDSVVTGDYNVDGFLDLFVTNGFNMFPKGYGGPNKLYRNQGNGNHWIELNLVATTTIPEAIGAVVTATANGVTQTRVVNGGYHRWSQEHGPQHFGLAGATTVDLSVRWPNGIVENYPGVTGDKLYRLTEGSGLAVVTPGQALAYPCGLPAYNTATETGVFIAKNCTNGTWQVQMSPGNYTLTYSGQIISSQDFVSIAPKNVESSDVFDTSVPSRIIYGFKVNGSGWDGMNFVPQAGSSTCFKLDAPAGAAVYLGPLRAPMPHQFDIETLGPCSGLPPDVSVGPATVSEGGGQMDFTVSLSAASSNTVTVTVATANGTATAGSDYTAVGPATVTFAPGETSKTVSVPVLQDTLTEGNETLTLTLSSPVNATLGTAQGTGTIVDDEDTTSCGAPSYNAGTTGGVFLWQNCSTGLWSMRVTGGGSASTLTYTGSVTSSASFVSVQPYSIEATDVFDSATNPTVISYALKTGTIYQDGFDFMPAGGAVTCFGLTGPAGAIVRIGVTATPVTVPFRLDTLGPCP